MIPLERGSREEQNDTNFNFVAPSIEQSSPLEVMSVQRKTMDLLSFGVWIQEFLARICKELKSSRNSRHTHMHVRTYSNTFDILRVM